MGFSFFFFFFLCHCLLHLATWFYQEQISKEIILSIDNEHWNRMSFKWDFVQERDMQLGNWRQIGKKVAYNLKYM